MKDFLTYNWKTITLSILGIIFVYLLVRVLTPVPDMSDLNKYKLEQIDKHIDEMKKLQKSRKKRGKQLLHSKKRRDKKCRQKTNR